MRPISAQSRFQPLRSRLVRVAMFAALFLAARTFPADKPLGEIAQDAASACAKGDWRAAIALYETLVERDVADPALFYNLGTSYARAGETGRAVWMLLRARRLDPRDGMIRDNLVRLAPDVESQVAVFPLFPLEVAASALSMSEWSVLAAFLTVVGAILWTCFFLPSRPLSGQAMIRKAAVVATVCALSAHLIAGAKYYHERLVSRGVVVADNVYPRETPDEEGAASEFTLKPGTVIRVENAGVEGWIKAVYGGKNEVFIRRDQIEFL